MSEANGHRLDLGVEFWGVDDDLSIGGDRIGDKGW
jgi:hypothetical protein